MNLQLLISSLLVLLPVVRSSSEELLEQLDLPFLSELRFKVRLEQSRPRQCALYWVGLNSKLNIPNEDDGRALVEQVDTDLLTKLAEILKSRSKKLAEYLEECVVSIKEAQHNPSSSPKLSNQIDDSKEEAEKREHFASKIPEPLPVNPNFEQQIAALEMEREELKREIARIKQVQPAPLPGIKNPNLEQQVASLEAEREELRKELEKKAKHIHYESVMHQADMVALSLKEKVRREEIQRENSDLSFELESLKRKVATLEADNLKMLKDQSEREVLLRKKALDSELELAKRKSDECSTKVRELELLKRIGELENELKAEREHNLKSASALQADVARLRIELSSKEEQLKNTRAQVEANKSELANARKNADSERKEFWKLNVEASQCKAQLNNHVLKVQQLETNIKGLEASLSQSKAAAKENLDRYEKSRDDWRKEKAAKEEVLLRLDKHTRPSQNSFFPAPTPPRRDQPKIFYFGGPG